MKKRWSKGNEIYWVIIHDDSVTAGVFVKTLGDGYGNGYGTEYIVDLNIDSKKYASIRVECYNSTWACRGHGMNDDWTEAEDNIKREEAIKFVNEIKKEFEEAEDETRDVKELYEKVREFVINNIKDYEEYDEDY